MKLVAELKERSQVLFSPCAVSCFEEGKFIHCRFKLVAENLNGSQTDSSASYK